MQATVIRTLGHSSARAPIVLRSAASEGEPAPDGEQVLEHCPPRTFAARLRRPSLTRSARSRYALAVANAAPRDDDAIPKATAEPTIMRAARDTGPVREGIHFP